MSMQISVRDRIEGVRAEWARERPDLDTSPMAVIGRILRAERLASGPIKDVLSRYGLDRGGFDVLATLRRSGPPYRLTPTRLFQELVLTSGAMTHRVDALERDGLVERVGDPRDRRSTLVALTAKGKTVTDQAMTAHMAGEQAMLTALPDAERQLLAALLGKLLAGMETDHE
jgi:DNA-binding MarR family transcriptional regulator